MSIMQSITLAHRVLSKKQAVQHNTFNAYLFRGGSHTSGCEAFAVVCEGVLGQIAREVLMPLTYLGFGHMAGR